MNIVIQKLNQFIDDPDSRIKKHTPNLADIILYSIFYTNYDTDKFNKA